MGPKAYLADFTRKWCSGSTKSFDLLRMGSSPLFLRSWRDFNPHDSLYQSGPLKFRHKSFRVRVVGVGLQRRLEGLGVTRLGLVL